MIENIKHIGNNIFTYDLRFIYFLVRIEERITLKFFFKLMTRLGDGILYTIIGISDLFLLGENEQKIGLALVYAFSIQVPIYKIIKSSVKRVRPFEKVNGLTFLINVPDKYSFPSGHTASAFLFASIISYQFAVLTIPIFIFAALIGLSRIYLRVHFPTDVLFGILLGLLSAEFGLWLAIS